MDAPALVGRTSELGRLYAALGDVERYGGAVLVGAVGTGRTRLAREAHDRTVDDGHPTAWVAGSRAASTVALGALHRFVPDDVAPLDPLARMTATAAVIRSLRGDSPLRPVLVVDDAHLLDGPSAAVIADLARDRSVAVLVVLDAAEPAPDAITDLIADDRLVRVEIGPLDRDGADALAEEVAGGPLTALTREELWRLTHGRPQPLVELLRGMSEEGLLEKVGPVRRHTGPFPGTAAAHRLVAPQLGALTNRERELVEVLALAGPLDIGVTERLTGPSSVTALEDTGVVTITVDDADGCVVAKLADDLLRGVVTANLSSSRRRKLSRLIADEIEASPAHHPRDPLRVAVLRLDAGEETDPDLLVRAAEEANGHLDLTLAERLARAAVTRGGGWPARLALARILSLQDRPDEAERALERADAAGATTGAPAEVAIARADHYLYTTGEPGRATAVLDRALVSVTDDDRRVDLLARKVVALAEEGEITACIETAGKIDPADARTPEVRVAALTAVSLAAILADRTPQALNTAEQGIAAATAIPDLAPVHDLRLRDLRARALVLAGQLGEAEHLARADHAEAVRRPSADHAASTAVTLGFTLLAIGRIGEAARHLAGASGRLRHRDPLALASACLAARAYAAALLGDTARARSLLGEARDASLRPHRLPVWIHRAEAWIAAQDGAVTEAVAVLDAAVSAGEARRVWGVELLHDAVRLGSTGTAAVLRDQVADVGGGLVALFAAHADALAAGDAQALEAVSDRLAGVGADLLAAEALAQAAAIHQSEERSRESRRTAARALALTDDCGGIRTPALSAAVVPLTERERETATLASQGLTNRSIAERLGVSVRTIDNHLHRAYRKLGINGREELASVLDPRWKPEGLTSGPSPTG